MRSSPAPHPCANCAFFDSSVWQPVAGSNVSTLVSGFSRRDIDSGQALFHQGDDNQGIFCVSRGLIALRSYQEDGSSILLKLAYPGDLVGFRSFLADEPHRTEARAVLPSRICTVAHRAAGDVVRGDPAVLTRVAGRCVGEINNSRDRIVATATGDNKDRLIEILVKLMRTYGRQEGENLQMRLPLSRTDLADLLGITPETVSRVLKRLKDEGVIRVSGRDIRIPVAKVG
ncbi:Crp/Fnr family transcriptional regulator [Shimia haliotis]|uniref:CRP/FNR family transcriptional regulator, anaerobic regulatory protein n=1 Tax=Shimia haliotis TaxID=1280847 RepID=A0A1I4F354_9RHOB|nr:Crp/Fnr family transcriptional regulator [Shimia haliotis]SFL11196.1 CRP/FNR family transcriptional regulator, anaerobic regulatory protein [Shimia haliotis]